MEHEDRFNLMMMDALDGELAAGERAELEAHFRACPDCAREWQALLMVEMLFRQTPLLMPAFNFASRTVALLPNRRARRMALGTIYSVLLFSGFVPLIFGIFLAVRYAPVLSRPELLGGIWSSLAGAGRAIATIIDALFAGAERFIIEQPVLIGWLIVLAGLVFLWGGVFQRLLMQPSKTIARNQ